MFELIERSASCVSGPYERADARSRQKVNGDCIFFKNTQDAQMRNAAREPSAERHAHNRATLLVRFTVGEVADSFYRRADPSDDVAHGLCPCYIEHFSAYKVAEFSD